MIFNSNLPIVLCFIEHYLPGFRHGGPVRSISNLVDHLCDQYEFLIITRDRDVFDLVPYKDIVVDQWNRVGNANVYYASNNSLSPSGIISLLDNTPHDYLYLNSFFAFDFSILPLLARRAGLVPLKPCVVAPRGEFSFGAMALSTLKKKAFIYASKIIGLHRYLYWQASTVLEAADIVRVLRVSPEIIKIAPDLPPVLATNPSQTNDSIYYSQRKAKRFVFLSRIDKMKNLDFLLRALIASSSSSSSSVDLHIYGPICDQAYWARCTTLMSQLPPNILAEFRGEVKPNEVLEVLSSYDLFVLPTRGENFGHVILESLISGTPVLISNQTPWEPSLSTGAVQVLPLDNIKAWTSALEHYSNLNATEVDLLRDQALSYARQYLCDSHSVELNRLVFSF